MASVQVSIDDVQNRYEGVLRDRFTDEYLETQISDAVDYADARWSAKIESRLAAGVLTEGLYKRVIADAVLRVVRNPAGLASENDGGYGYATRATVASGNLWFTSADEATLTGSAGQTMLGTVGIGLDRGWG